ncbi:hypothetical protein HZ326_23378 [Fusarium oxysporum f. sp. albedinis]|nr:hypothetical protein HZ326_23378 [Fusarium oxysporum f. sp. albedinis]
MPPYFLLPPSSWPPPPAPAVSPRFKHLAHFISIRLTQQNIDIMRTISPAFGRRPTPASHLLPDESIDAAMSVQPASAAAENTETTRLSRKGERMRERLGQRLVAMKID